MTEDAGVLADLDGALAATGRVVAGVGAGQWAARTPCSELDTRALVNHMVSGNLMFTATVRGGALPDRSADHLGGDPHGAFDQPGAALSAAFGAPGSPESTYLLRSPAFGPEVTVAGDAPVLNRLAGFLGRAV
jgi:Mycothiol maleylpyruvate isomerase N-terminal domain